MKQTQKTSFYKCLDIILDKSEWIGNQADIACASLQDPTQFGLADLLEALSHLGFACDEQKMSLQELDQKDLPALYIHNKRPYVLVELGDSAVLVHDVETDRQISIKRSDKVLLIHTFTQGSSVEEIYKLPSDSWIRHVFKRFRGPVLVVLCLSFLISILEVLAPVIVIILLGQISIFQKEPIKMEQLALGVLVYLASLACFRIVRVYILSFLAARLGNIVGIEVLRRVLLLPPIQTETAPLGSQLARLRDFDSIEAFISGPALAELSQIPFTIVILIGLYVIGGSIVLVPVTVILIFIILITMVNRISPYLTTDLAKAERDRHEFLVDTFTHTRPLQLLGISKKWEKRFAGYVENSLKNKGKSQSYYSIIANLSYGIISTAGIATAFVGVQLAVAGQLDPSSLLACMMLTWRSLAPLRSGFIISSQFSRVTKSINQINRLMRMNHEKNIPVGAKLRKEISGKMSFAGVSFRYSKDSYPALLNINFSLEPNQTLLVTGYGSSGKSTVLRLILGAYRAQAGRILHDNVNIAQLDPFHLRRQISYLPEESSFLPGTIRDNLLHANPLAHGADIDLALAETGLIQDLTKMPYGIDTTINPNQTKLFDRDFIRRLGFAMLLIKNSKLWLLDNPGFELDATHEKQVQATLGALKGAKTIVIASRNIEYIKLADYVLWLDGGKARGFGPRDAIIKLMQAKENK